MPPSSGDSPSIDTAQTRAAAVIACQIAPGSVPAFIGAQIIGGILGTVVAVVRSAPTLKPGSPDNYGGMRMADIPEVLFVCTHNAGRSQMAAALLEREAAGKVRVMSAGSEPADHLNPAVVQAMAEIGIDISREIPKRLSTDQVRAADVVITMGCGDACPVYPGKRYLDWNLPDPAGLDLAAVRPIRNTIRQRVAELLAELT
jgi:arsenate reductase (thioredoxin)